MADQWKEELKIALQNNDQAQAAKMAQEYLDKMNNIRLNIAITGNSGSGKSTLVNALRDIENDTEGAAKTGAVETTMEPTEYIHPEMPNIRFWDLPGIGSVKFTADKYIKKMEFKKYDFFMIVSSERFTENDVKLAKEIHKIKKKFYFVRSQIDHSISSQPRRDPNTILESIRENCTAELVKLGFKSPKVFLVSGLKLHLYDFEGLRETLMEELPEHQRDVLLLALPNSSLEAIEQKKKTFEKKIIWLTLVSAGVGGVPIPGLSESVDLGIIMGFTVHCAFSMGLTPKLLRKLSDLSGVPYDDLMAVIKSPFAGVEITPDLMVKLLARSAAFITAMVLEQVASFIPVIGTVIAMGISGVTTYKVLTYILNSLSDDAQRVFKKAWL